MGTDTVVVEERTSHRLIQRKITALKMSDEWEVNNSGEDLAAGGDGESPKNDSGCRKCGEDGHFARECPNAEPDKCRKCKEEGLPTQTPQALIITPTRELAIQIEGHAKRLLSGSCLKSVCAYGGTSTGWSRRQLSNGYNVLVATPGRLLDFV